MSHDNSIQRLQSEAFKSGSGSQLERKMNSLDLIMIGIGAIVGAGIFVSTGIVAAENTGPSIVFSFVIAALGCLCTALCYAEFSAMVPVSGSAYSYTYATFGRFTAWLIGWCLILEYLMAAAAVGSGWSGYLAGLISSLNFKVPNFITTSPLAIDGDGLRLTGAWLNAPAFLILGALSAIQIRGLTLSLKLNAVLVILKLSIIILFIICGAFFIDAQNWTPFIPENTGTFGEYGWSGILRGAGVIFYAYLGFDAVSTAARETRNPQRNMPIGIIGSLALCTLLYILFSLTLTGIAPYQILGTASPISTALDHVGERLHFLKLFVEIGALFGLTSVMLVLLYGQSRILFAMARDGLVPNALATLHPRFRTPAYGIALSGFLAAAAGSLLPISILGELISIGTLTAFVFVCAGVLILRRRHPDIERPFRTPWATFTCVCGILICGYMMLNLPLKTWIFFSAWMTIGIVVFLLYRTRQKSVSTA